MPSVNPTIIDFWKSSGKDVFQDEDKIHYFYENCIYENCEDNQNLDNVFLQEDRRYINIISTCFDNFDEIESWLKNINYNVKTFIADFKNQILVYKQNAKIEKMEIPYEEEKEDSFYYDKIFQEEDFSNDVDELEEMLIKTYQATEEIKYDIQFIKSSTERSGKYSKSIFKWMQESVNKKNTNNAVTLDTLDSSISEVQNQLMKMSSAPTQFKKENSDNMTDNKTNSRFSFTESLLFLFVIFVMLLVVFKL